MPASTAVVVDTNQTVELVTSCEAIPVQAVSINELHSSSEELNELTSAVQMPTAKKQSNIAKLTSGSTIEEMIRLRNLKTSQNITESVPVPSSEHVAEIVGRQGCKIKALRAKTNTYIKTPIRGEQPQFVITGRKEDVITAKREIQLAADHFSQIRARRGNGANTPIQGQQMIPSPCHTRQGTPTPPINTPCKTNSVSSSSSSSISLSPPAVHKINTLSQDLASSISPKLTEGVPDQLINSLDTNELHSSCTLIRQQTEQVMQLQPGQIITKVCVPYQVVGLVVGPRGTTIKRIQQNTNTYIITPSRDSQPVFAIQGLPDNVAQAKIEIENYIQLRTNTSSGQGHLLNGYNSCSSSSSTSSSVDPSGYFQSNSTCGGANTIGSFSSNDYEFFSNGLELMDDLKLKNNTLLQESSIWSSPANTFGAQSDDCLVNSIQQNLNPTLNSLNGIRSSLSSSSSTSSSASSSFSLAKNDNTLQFFNPQSDSLSGLISGIESMNIMSYGTSLGTLNENGSGYSASSSLSSSSSNDNTHSFFQQHENLFNSNQPLIGQDFLSNFQQQPQYF